jgi:hypothetical protein
MLSLMRAALGLRGIESCHIHEVVGMKPWA